MASYPYHVLNGLQVPLFVSQEMLDELKTFELYPDDIWIATYPKCGTTWTQQIVKLIRNRGEKDDVKISAVVPWPEAIKHYPGVPQALGMYFRWKCLGLAAPD